MTNIYPNLEWYKNLSSKKSASPRCPYANVHRCNRYYSSLYLLGEINITTKMAGKSVVKLDQHWEQSDLIPVIQEHDPAVGFGDGKLSSISNFCPEISFDFFGLFAEYMAKYVNEIDKYYAQNRLSAENVTEDWRWDWAYVKPTHYMDCSVYSQVLGHSSMRVNDGFKDEEIITMKPGFMGFSVNLKSLYKWITSKKNNKLGKRDS